LNPITPPRSRTVLSANRNFVQSLAKGLEILAEFSNGQLLGNQELVVRTGLPKATVSRLTSTLVALGYLRVDPVSRKMLMGARVLSIGANYQRHVALQQVARPWMAKLSEALQMTVSLATRDQLEMVFLEVVKPPPNSIRLVTNTDIGSMMPIACTSIGLAYVVGASVRERSEIVQALSQRHPTEWPTWRKSIERAHLEYERQGFVISQRSWGREVNAVGVPLTLREHQLVAAFHCAGPASLHSLPSLRRRIGPRLRDTVSEIAQAMSDRAQTRS
jgi:DNA-binding IclR family transcriptional regulator